MVADFTQKIGICRKDRKYSGLQKMVISNLAVGPKALEIFIVLRFPRWRTAPRKSRHFGFKLQINR